MSSLNHKVNGGEHHRDECEREPASTADAATTGCGQSLEEGAASLPQRTGQSYWRSLDEFTGSPEFAAAIQREFSSAAQDLLTAEDRRQFMKVMGASFAMAGLTLAGCRRWPEEHIAPFASRPENRMPGQTVGYATSIEFGGFATGLVATSFDGRPIKIEGNSLHPESGGATTAFAQASVLDLYDPDRSRTVRRGDAVSTLADFTAFLDGHRAELSAARGAGLAILAEASESPSVLAMRERMRSLYPEMRWIEWEPINDDNERAGTAIALGAPHRAHLTLHDDESDGVHSMVTLSLGADFLLDHPESVRLTREHARTRRIGDEAPAQQQLGRLYSIDSGGTITAASADHHIAVRAVDVVAVAAMITELVLETLGCGTPSVGGGLMRLAASAGADAALDAHDREVIAQIAKDLLEFQGQGAVVVGRNQPAEVHALACLLNERLGNVGRTVRYLPTRDADRSSRIDGLRALTEAMGDGSVRTLVIIGANPVYTAPADIDFAGRLAAVPTSVHLGVALDETARACTWHLPRAHYLECWADGRAADGTISIGQPLIEPLVGADQGGLSSIELLAHLAGDEVRDGHSIVRRTFAETTGAAGEDLKRRWRQALHDGLLIGSAAVGRDPAMDPGRVGESLGRLADRLERVTADAIEVVFRPCAKLHDGRFANNGWLQELPEPVTKVAWDNAAVIGYGFAQELGVTTGDLISLTLDGRSLEIAVLVLPGYASRSIWLALGYGRDAQAGRVAEGAGFNTYRLRASAQPDIAIGAAISRTAGRYEIVSSQDRGAGNPVADSGVQARLPSLVREATLAEYREKPTFARYRTHVTHRLSLWEESNLDGAQHRWAMSVDLNTCTGCSACVVACQAENNIPIVGKEQMRRGREMHWLRIDRYFRGTSPDRPDRVAFQPVTCMHCEMAPCEQVCPVAATVHDEEGLNTMVYNRCIGTRYCSNNCPYKVRRFNYFDWHRMDHNRDANWIQHPADYYLSDGPDQWRRLQFNPSVTVRTRGVMEKCTFCTQRITEGRIKAKNSWARAGGRSESSPDYVIPDGTIVPACAQACPAQAIVFGDLNDPQSKVAKLMAKPISYEMLEELNTKPRLRYLAKVRNPGVEHDRDACDEDHTTPQSTVGEGARG